MLKKNKKIFQSEPKTYIEWKNNLYISLGIGVVFGSISIYLSLPLSLKGSIRAVELFLLITGLAFVTQVQIEIMHFFFHNVEHNPIIRSLPDISKKIQEIPNLTIKNGSLDFAVDSFKKMANEGFVQVNIPMKDYIKYLILIAQNAKQCIYGSNIFRPIKTIEDIYSNTQGISEYLNIILESKCKRKIRINILSKEDIKGIIMDAIKALTANDGKNEQLANEFIPEIVWYLKVINGWQNSHIKEVDILWTTHDLAISNIHNNMLPVSNTSRNEIDDYAIFDEQILALYDYNEAKHNGTMVLHWDSASDSNSSSKVKMYLAPFENIQEQLRENKIDKNTNLFLSFSELVNKIDWGKLDISIEKLNLEAEIKQTFSTINNQNLYSLYLCMAEKVKSSAWKFTNKHCEYFFNKDLKNHETF
ncbi:MAG: hypothetical protein HUU08_10905 [Candidatus Brocadia sp.]|nr:hypothetical protein [Candidatus Brocadia sp.]